MIRVRILACDGLGRAYDCEWLKLVAGVCRRGKKSEGGVRHVDTGLRLKQP